MVNNYNSCCSAYAEVLPHKVNTTPPNKVFQAAPEGKTPPPLPSARQPPPPQNHQYVSFHIVYRSLCVINHSSVSTARMQVMACLHAL